MTVVAPVPAAVVELWVDASAPGPGQGLALAPYRSLQSALDRPERPRRIHLRAGLYAGPFTLDAGTELIGAGATTVLHAESSGPVVRVAAGGEGQARLEALTVQGGAVGVEVLGRARLDRVALSGQRQVAVSVSGTGSALVLEGGEVQATVSEARGVVLGAGAVATVHRTRFRGPFRRAVEAREAGRLSIDAVRFEGAVTAIHVVGGALDARELEISGGRGPGLFLAQTRAVLDGVGVHGHEYGLQAGAGTQLEARGLTSIRAERAGVALVDTRAELRELVVIDSGSSGGLQTVGGDVTVRGFRIHHPEAAGVSARQGQLRLEDGVISSVTDLGGAAGDGLQLRALTAEVRGVVVREAAGAGVLASEASRVRLVGVVLERCRVAGLIAEREAEVRAPDLQVLRSRGPAVAVPDHAQVWLGVLRSHGNAEGPYWAECAQGAALSLWRLDSDAPAPRTPCVRRADAQPGAGAR